MSALCIRGARVFDGAAFAGSADVLVEDGTIAAVGSGIGVPDGAEVVDGAGGTLLPGLIDAHIHVRPPGLAELAIAFGVTTVLDMGSEPAVMTPYRERARRDHGMADIRTPYAAATPPGGHPAPLVGLYFERPGPGLEDPADAAAFVDARIAEGADYIKLVIEDGSVFGASLPALSPEASAAVVASAHERDKLAVAHVHTLAAARQAVESGADGLAHLFLDAPIDDDLLERMVAAGTFVTPTLTLLEAMAGRPSGAGLAQDPRVRGLLAPEWVANLERAWRFEGPARYEHAAATARRLHQAGVPLLAGTDAACLGVLGTAPGVSLHRELQLLVADAGLSPAEALSAATSAPAGRFGLDDRGRIAPGARADLVLLEADPEREVADTVSIAGVWRRGQRVDREAAAGAGFGRVADQAGAADGA